MPAAIQACAVIRAALPEAHMADAVITGPFQPNSLTIIDSGVEGIIPAKARRPDTSPRYKARKPATSPWTVAWTTPTGPVGVHPRERASWTASRAAARRARA